MTGDSRITRLLTALELIQHGRAGAAMEDIRAAEDQLGRTLPDDHRAFLMWSNGWEGLYGESYLHLGSIDDILLANAPDFQESFPGLIAVGGDLGMETYALDYRQAPARPAWLPSIATLPSTRTSGSLRRASPRQSSCCLSSQPVPGGRPGRTPAPATLL
jgi:hypothetical protein